jgi:hypothetical protein
VTVINPDITELNRIFGQFDCPNLIAVVNHTAFAAATRDMITPVQLEVTKHQDWGRLVFRLNDIGDELASLADIIDEFDDPELLALVEESDRKCGRILERLAAMEQQNQQSN